MVLDYILCFEAPGLIAQFSKCDFWNLGNFLNRNMWSIFFRRKYFDRNNFDQKTKIIFRDQKIFDFFSMNKSLKIENFEILEKVRKNRNFEILIFH